VAWIGKATEGGADPTKFCKVAPGGGCSPVTLPIPRRHLAGQRLQRLPGPRGGKHRLRHPTDVFLRGSEFVIDDNADMVTDDGGNGWLVYKDATGLHLADLAPITGPPSGEGRRPRSTRASRR
jgi:hypothetical protein